MQDQRVRFSQDSRHGDWSKGDEGIITKTLVIPPQNQKEISIVKLDSGVSVWATTDDFVPWDQLSLF